MAQADLHLSLLIPGLFACAIDASAEGSFKVAELKTLLARSEHTVCSENPDTLLFDFFGYKPDAQRNLPVASVTHALDTGESSEGYWLRADPVYMRVGSDRVMMMGNDLLDINNQEAAALCKELSPLFKIYGLQLITPEPKRWYLRLTDDPNIFWHGLNDVRGNDIHQYLPLDIYNEKNARLWRRILNETQMILHDSPVNHEREARGELPVNSLWFWGGGTLPQISRNRFAQVWGNDALVSGLAKLSATPRTASPANGAAWLAQAITPGEHLVAVEAVNNFIVHDTASDISAQKNNIESLNHDWFSPLLAALKSRQLASLRFYTGNGAAFYATSSSVARWWKRPRNLAFYKAQSENAFNTCAQETARLSGGIGK